MNMPDTKRPPYYKGLFEIHITIRVEEAEALEKFRAFCAENGVKPILIETTGEAHARQPMTQSVVEGTRETAFQEARSLAQRLRDAGFDVIRLKIEAAPGNEDLPESDDDTREHSCFNYFEFHLRVSVPEGGVERLRELATSHSTHLSHNAWRPRTAERADEERFVTLRCYHQGRATAQRSFERLENALKTAGYPILKSVAEYCVYDSNIKLDEEWLDI